MNLRPTYCRETQADTLSLQNLVKFYGQNAVHLEGFIKGALAGKALQRRATFDDFRSYVRDSKKLINGNALTVDEP